MGRVKLLIPIISSVEPIDPNPVNLQKAYPQKRTALPVDSIAQAKHSSLTPVRASFCTRDRCVCGILHHNHHVFVLVNCLIGLARVTKRSAITLQNAVQQRTVRALTKINEFPHNSQRATSTTITTREYSKATWKKIDLEIRDSSKSLDDLEKRLNGVVKREELMGDGQTEIIEEASDQVRDTSAEAAARENHSVLGAPSRESHAPAMDGSWTPEAPAASQEETRSQAREACGFWLCLML